MSKKKRSRKNRAKEARPVRNSAASATVDKAVASNPGKESRIPFGLIAAIFGVAVCAFLLMRATVWSPTSVSDTNKENTKSQAIGSDPLVSGNNRQVATGSSTRTASIQLPTAPGLEKQRFDSVVRSVAEREDPVLDGWDSERFNEAASKQLKIVGKLLSSTSIPPGTLEKSVAESYASSGVRPANLQPAYKDQSIDVTRGDNFGQKQFKGIDGFVELIALQREPFAGLSNHHFKFKIIRVEQTDAHTLTTAYFQLDAHSPETAKQVNATWNCRWVAGNDPDHPLLESIEVDNYEEITYASGPMFVDCTESIFRDSDRFHRQLIYGIDHWTDQFDGAIARPAAGHGIAIGDVNGDGLDDVYLCQSPALPNLLLIQNPDGTVRDTAVEAGVNWLEGTRAALLADLDNDGDQDLVAVLGSKVVVQANDGTGNFSTATIISTPSSLFQINAVDYDNDADLDLFICGYTLSGGVDVTDVFANPMPFHDANNGAPNVMLRNDGQWAFHDVTNEIGLGQNNRRFSYASAWDDFDGDNDLDVYIANDFGRNNLYRNDGGTFQDVAAELQVEDIGPGMSASWGDFNNDGRSDIYVSNMFSSAGNRITHQQQFKTGLDEETKKHFQRHARGNSLFENAGDGTFNDRSVDLGITLGRWAWGSLFADINNDGWEDIYVTNGFITADTQNDL